MTSFEDTLRKKITELEGLGLAVKILQNKDALIEQLFQAKQQMASVMEMLEATKQDLKTMKAQNVELRNLSSLLEKTDKYIVHMNEYLPAEFINDFTELSQAASPCVTNSARLTVNSARRETNRHYLTSGTPVIKVETPGPPIQDCKKTLFKNSDDSYVMDLLSDEEFLKIPKYMIGRQTLATVNSFVTVINQILEGKYTLLSMGKNEARKKGKLELYLSLKREEIVVAPGEDPLYFFTAEDYHRHTQTKLDKMKLNLLTVLRHCKRLRELRTGKTLQYVVIPSWERSRD